MDDATVEMAEAQKDVASAKARVFSLEQKLLASTEAARRRDPEHQLALARAELAQAERAAQDVAAAQAALELERLQDAGREHLIAAGQSLAGVIVALGRYRTAQLELFHKASGRDFSTLAMLRDDTEAVLPELRALARALKSWLPGRYGETGLEDPEQIQSLR